MRACRKKIQQRDAIPKDKQPCLAVQNSSKLSKTVFGVLGRTWIRDTIFKNIRGCTWTHHAISRCHVSQRAPLPPVLVSHPLLRSCMMSRTDSIPFLHGLLLILSTAEDVHKLIDAVSDHIVHRRAVGNFTKVFSFMIQVILWLDAESLTRMSCSCLYSSHRSQSRRSASSNLPPLSVHCGLHISCRLTPCFPVPATLCQPVTCS